MATVTKKVIYKNKYLLELSEKEAEVLRSLTGFVKGHPHNPDKKYINNVYYALAKAGILYKRLNSSSELILINNNKE